MDSNNSEIKCRTKLEKRLASELNLLRYQLDHLKQQSQQIMSETEQEKKLLERKYQPLLLGK